MIRVFHLIKSLGRGGAEMLLADTLRCAERDRFAFAYGYFLPWKNALEAPLVDQGAEVVCFGRGSPLGILSSAGHVARVLRRWKADVLHCHLPLAGVVGRCAGRLVGVPVVYTEHNSLERYHPGTRRLNVMSWSWQDAVIAVSGDVARSIERHVAGNVPVHVIMNGVDVDVFDASEAGRLMVRRRLGISPDVPVIGTVAVFRHQKALDLWLEAAALLRRLHGEARFLLVGDGPLRKDLEATTHRLGLEGAVIFAGLQEDVRPFLAAMDVYLMSSRFEGLPLALLEAMAMRRAVVATAVGGVPEVVQDGVNGRLVPPERPEALAGAVAAILSDDEHRLQLGTAARRSVQEAFSVGRTSRQIESLYREVVRGR